MSESATGLRERRKSETQDGLKRAARRLTTERGLHGFTIDELCAEIDVSRRTFFNYFASKENAVLGFPAHIDSAEIEEQFACGSTTPAGNISPSLVDDLATLMIERWAQFGFDASEGADVTAAVLREPKLLTHAIHLASEGARGDRELVERREGLAAGDVRASVVVRLTGAVSQLAAEEFFAQSSTDPFPIIFLRQLAAARLVFAQ